MSGSHPRVSSPISSASSPISSRASSPSGEMADEDAVERPIETPPVREVKGDVKSDVKNVPPKSALEPSRYHPLPPWRRIGRKVLIVFSIVLVSLYALYLIGANVALKTRIVRNAVSSFPARTLDYSSAWTVWPGVVHVKDLHIRVQDSLEEFLIVLDDTVAELDLRALFHRRLHARWVNTRGVSLRFRERIDPRVDQNPVTYALPPIEGFAEIPWKKLDYERPLTGKDLEEVFTFDIERIDVSAIREIWIDDYHFVGDGHASGFFHLAPSRNVAVGPAHVEVYRGAMYVGNDVVFEDATGKIDGTIDWFQPRSAFANEILEHLTSVDAALDAHVPSYAFVERRYLDGDASPNGPHLAGGAGRLHVDLHVRHGDLVTGTNLALDAKDFEVRFGNRRIKTGSVSSLFEVKDHEGVPQALMHLDLAAIDLFLTGSAAEKTPTLTAPMFGVFGRSKNLELVKPFNDLLYSVDVPQLKLLDLRVLQRFLPNGTAMRIGKGTMLAHLHLDATRAAESGQALISAKSDDAFVHYHDDSLSGKIALELKVGNLDLDTLNGNLSHSTLDFTDVVLTEGTDHRPPWSGHFALDAAALRPKQKNVLATDVVMKLHDVRPILRLYAAGDGIPEWVAKMLPMENFEGRARIRVNDGIDIDDFRARAEDTGVGARLHSHKGYEKGQMLLEWHGLSLGLDIVGGKTKPVLVGATDWYTGGKTGK